MFDDLAGHGEDMDAQMMLKAITVSLNRIIGPKYKATIVGNPMDFDVTHIAQAMAIECTEGEGDAEEIEELIRGFMSDGRSPFTFVEDTPQHEPDDLLNSFNGHVGEQDSSPAVDLFYQEMLDHFRLAHGTVGGQFYEMVKTLRDNGVDYEIAKAVVKSATLIYREGADLQGFMVDRLISWDRNNASPSSLVVAGRAFVHFIAESEAPGEVETDRAQHLYHLKHQWRYHQANLVAFDRDIFEGIWKNNL